MKAKLLGGFMAAALAVAGVVYGGTRAAEVSGEIPSASNEGVPLDRVESCRFSIRVLDGGTINGGKLVAYYYDPVLGWVRSPSALDCTLEANKLIDAGAPAAQVCADTTVLGRYGRVSAATQGVVNGAGAAATGFVRVECYGGDLP